MNLETLNSLLDISNRTTLYSKILIELEKVKNLDYIIYQPYETAEGIMPIIKISKNSNFNEIMHVKIFMEHNIMNIMVFLVY
ncbi:hypothetical protein ES703_45860 [subsurface metagenome]